MRPPNLTGRLRQVWSSGRHYSFPSASSFPPGSCASCPPPGYRVVNSFSFLLQISMQSHLWLPLYPGPIPHLQIAIKKGKPRRGLQRSLFLKMPVFLLLPDPVLNHQDLQLDDSVTQQGSGDADRVGGKVVRYGGDGFQMTRDELEQGACCPPTTRSLRTSQNLLSWAPQGISKTETSKWTLYKLLLQNYFKHNINNKEECHKPCILSFGIKNYKTNLLVPQVVINWRLCNIKVMAK